MVKAVFSIFRMDLLKNTENDLGLDNGQATTSDGILELRFATFGDGFPIVAAPVDLVHAQLGSGAVGIAGILREDGADEGVENRWAVTAAGSVGGCDEGGGSLAWAVEGGEDAES